MPIQLGEKAKEQFEKDKAEYEAKVPANVRKERDQSVKKKAGESRNPLLVSSSFSNPPPPKYMIRLLMPWLTLVRWIVQTRRPRRLPRTPTPPRSHCLPS